MKGTQSGLVIAMVVLPSGAARMTPTNDAPGR